MSRPAPQPAPCNGSAPAASAALCAVAPAKINLHLEVLGLRPDGFHELSMVMQSLDLADLVRFHPRTDRAVRLRCDHPDLSVGEDNLILQAAHALRKRAALTGSAELPGVDLELVKRIPIGAGLAGGSSDAAAALIGLRHFWQLPCSDDDLHQLAATLGSDVPYCLEGGTQLCFGRGERLERPEGVLGPPGYGVLLIKHPGVQVSTPWAYGLCRERRGDFYLSGESDFEQRRQALRQGPLLAALRGERLLPPLRNDLQSVVEPEVACVAEGLRLLRGAAGVLAAAMSGSGPSLFALFTTPAAAAAAGEQLATALAAAGFEAWSCRCEASGARLLSGEEAA
ncbi:MAG: 4-(cytidine 5'-diphospho)-2-C-methyl-D-erythritol kinase [Cyanobium sp.]